VLPGRKFFFPALELVAKLLVMDQPWNSSELGLVDLFESQYIITPRKVHFLYSLELNYTRLPIPFRATCEIEICFQCLNVGELHTTSSTSGFVNITLKKEQYIHFIKIENII
jgi:hypothetical protein